MKKLMNFQRYFQTKKVLITIQMPFLDFSEQKEDFLKQLLNKLAVFM